MVLKFYCIPIALAASLCLLALGCDSSPTDSQAEFRPTLYIEGFLSAGNPVDNIFVGVTTPLYETVDRDQSGVSDAAVTLEVDGAASVLSPLPGKTGYYHLPTLRVEPGKTYRLTVEIEDGIAQAKTTVPFPPTVTASSTQLKIGGDPFSAAWEGETGAGYLTETVAQALEDRIPLESLLGGGRGRFGGFGGTGIDTTGFGALRDSLAAASRWRYTRNQSTTLDLRQFSHYGTYVFRVFTIDENYADFLISSTQDPQTLDEPRFHVSGGIGLFAAMAADSVVFIVE